MRRLSYGARPPFAPRRWPGRQVRAEVPFFSLGADDLTERSASSAEGAIDLLCTDPDDPARALVIDYK